MGHCKIFLVEDDKWYGEYLKYTLSLNPDFEVEWFDTGKKMLNHLHEKPTIITLDYSLPDFTGQELLKKIKLFNPEIPVIIISGQESVETAIDLLKEGAYDYIVKNDDAKDRVWNTIRNVVEHLQLKKDYQVLQEEVSQKYEFNDIIKGNSPALQKVFALLRKAGKSNITVSVTGETGTGKELVAKAVHYNSDRKKKPFVAVNVTAIPAELLESELFGHEKGAFTGAVNRRIGKFEEADKGTLFLDEIGDLGLDLQAKLLRVLQEREITRLGSNGVKKIDVRLIVATHKNLKDLVKKGQFRQDLYYRLLGLPIQLPPLRERGNDIILLAKFCLQEFCKENKMGKLSFTNEAKKKLMGYSYPGNVRELKAIVELSAVMADGKEIMEEDIVFDEIDHEAQLMLGEMTLADYNRKIIKLYLKKYDKNVLKVAKVLEIGKSTIYKMMKNNEL
ncbi:sigma-54 dependent transcriptional regulator [Flammeovirgaceae bacterium SG7u.111]|nr:sigma-54 dependent transcriptional regulator [Flammeovirgaceae bacterium SG7u.132]WPO34550.1 sigma-54 dependent transcriptional regulator [Flammeovirgaceae bacterium SG7u.111]